MSGAAANGRISFIWLDLGYTLLYCLREPTYRQVLRELGVDVAEEDLARAFHRTDKLFMREYPGTFTGDPRVYMPWYLGVLNHDLGLRLDICRLAQRWRELQAATADYWRAFDFARPVLERLKRHGLRLGVISNWDGTARAILDRQGLSGLFETIVISSEVGFEKPDERIFRLALENAGVSAAESLYVGDNYYDDAMGSAKVGMRALIINPYETEGVEELAGQTLIRDISGIEDHL